MADDASYIGQRISYGGALCTVRFIGEVAGTPGSWLGVEWDDATRGKHDGSHKGVRYFQCLAASPTAASFVRPARPRDAGQSFLSALKEKYLPQHQQDGSSETTQIRISGTKVAEEVGFDKVWKKLAQVRDLKIVILDCMRIAVARRDGDEAIGAACPSIVHVDLSRNLFDNIGPVVQICAELPHLRKLSISGNRFRDILSDVASLDRMRDAFRGVTELSVEETLLSWGEICALAARCPCLTTLNAGSNQFASVLPEFDFAGLSSTLTCLNLEFNDFTSLSDLASLTSLRALRNLYLKGNNITAIGSAGQGGGLVFAPSLQYLDVSYNRIADWAFVDALPAHFPGLSALRMSHNPVYDGRDDWGANQPSSSSSSSLSPSTSEESHMLTIGRVASLKSLNFAAVRPADRTNAEMFYLSRIAKQLARVPESAEHTVLEHHPRYAQLCDAYGAPDIIRRDEINPAFLEARLVAVAFRHHHHHHHHHQEGTKTVRIPKSYDIYAVKGIAGKIFGLSPLKVRLVWETGEWDPVAGYDDGDGELSSSEDDDGEEEQDERDQGLRDQGPQRDGEERAGRWIKREVELRDGPKQLGYCVDGQDASIRVEAI